MQSWERDRSLSNRRCQPEAHETIGAKQAESLVGNPFHVDAIDYLRIRDINSVIQRSLLRGCNGI